MRIPQTVFAGILPFKVSRPRLGLRRPSIGLLYTTASPSAEPIQDPISSPTPHPSHLTILGNTYPTDSWTNVTSPILTCTTAKLHLQQSHPISITRSLIESQFPDPTYRAYNTLSPVVTTAQNFDSLGFPADHPGRSRTDTYYINSSTVLRTHTSAHQLDVFRQNLSDGFTISADVYRRDAIDKSHYPVFHQMEGARQWDMSRGESILLQEIEEETLFLQDKVHGKLHIVEDTPVYHETRNPLQPAHSPALASAVASHLKRSLEGAVVELFSQALPVPTSPTSPTPTPLQVRWVEAYFPFTSPSWELEILWNSTWLEILGCGVVQHSLLTAANLPTHIAWAFGLGLERIAMVLFGIPDIRLFWSQDPRFLTQFTPGQITPFKPFSKYPSSVKDIAFWTSAAGKAEIGVGEMLIHEHDVLEVIRGVVGDLAEDVKFIDEFIHPKTGRKSLCYRIEYRSLEKTLTHKEVATVHEKLAEALEKELGVEVRK